MRNTIDRFLGKLHNEDIYLIHGDMWHFDYFEQRMPNNVIDCGIQEPNIVNIASGIASQNKTVFVYGVSGMIIHRAYEQIKLNVKGWAENKGKIIFINSGHNGCYTDAGRGHLIDDDIALCNALNIETYTPTSRGGLIRYIKNKLKDKNGTCFIRLGWDNCEW